MVPSQIKQEITNEGRINAELFSVRAEYSETYLQLQNEKKLTNSLKSDNLSLISRIKNMDEKLSLFEKEKSVLLHKLESSEAEISSLKNVKLELSKKIENADGTIDALKAENIALCDKTDVQKREINVLAAQSKQLQFGVIQSSKHNQHKKKIQTKDESSDEGLYEVQKLIDHKIIKRQRHFLIRWKGYDSSEDSWVPESQLNCPKILKSYLNSKNMQWISFRCVH